MMSTCILNILVFFAVSNTAEAFILRLPCKSFADFKEIRSDGALSATFSTLEFLDAKECQMQCILNGRCKSVNVHKDDNVCQLNDKSAEDKKDNIAVKSKAGWTYVSTLYNETLIGQNCRTLSPCSAGKRCMDTCDCPGYQCSDIDYCADSPCKNGGICASMADKFVCKCPERYIGVDCSQESLIWHPNCKLSSGASVGTFEKNACYNHCKKSKKIAAFYKKGNSACYCDEGVDIRETLYYDCIFIKNDAIKWESNCKYPGGASFAAKNKWHCYYYCKDLNYKSATFAPGSPSCTCAYAEEKTESIESTCTLV